MGSQLTIVLLANTDPTSSQIFRDLCYDSRLSISAVAFTTTLTKSKTYLGGVWDIFKKTGLGYFLYAAFWNGIFLLKEKILISFPFLRFFLFRDFFSLRIWAHKNGVQIIKTDDFNSQAFIDAVAQFNPDVLFTRINQILKADILNAAPHGCWCFHSSELPRYQGIAAEFHSLLNGEDTVGFTVMRMEEKLDAGAIIKQRSITIPENITLHRLIEENNQNAEQVIDEAVADLLAGEVEYQEQDYLLRSYYTWPTKEQTKLFRQKNLRYITFKQAIAYVLR